MNARNTPWMFHYEWTRDELEVTTPFDPEPDVNIDGLPALDRLRHLRDLMRGKGADDSSDIDRSLARLMNELDRRDGPGAGERMLFEVAASWLKEQVPMEGYTHGD